MSERNDGGPAFPVADYDHQVFRPKTVDDAKRLLSGMSLRDYFAAKAMQALIPLCVHDTREEGVTYEEQIAESAYSFADAMLAAREGS